MLLDQDDIYNDMLHEFLAQDGGHPQVSWIHDIRIEHYKEATEKLTQEADKELDLKKKKVCGSSHHCLKMQCFSLWG